MEDYILELTDISKAFPGVKALSHVTMEVKRGEIMGLVGENGAGKSTLMKILTGVYQRDSGSIRINGTEARISNPLEAQKLGLSIIFQEMNLVDSLSIAENIFVGRLPKKGIWGIQWKEVQRNAEELLEKVGLKKNPGVKVELLSIAEKQMVEIAKALSFQARLIVMDEPSATLTEKEQRHLFDIVEVLKREGITVIYISHRLDEIFKLCDRVTILRDGQVIDTKAMGELTREQIITKMVGRELEESIAKNISLAKLRGVAAG
jgi:ribose transport system ATP-binding protein